MLPVLVGPARVPNHAAGQHPLLPVARNSPSQRIHLDLEGVGTAGNKAQRPRARHIGLPGKARVNLVGGRDDQGRQTGHPLDAHIDPALTRPTPAGPPGEESPPVPCTYWTGRPSRQWGLRAAAKVLAMAPHSFTPPPTPPYQQGWLEPKVAYSCRRCSSSTGKPRH